MKDVVHVWELGGGLKLKDMLMVPITPANIANVAICITIDLSEPGLAVPTLTKWLELVRIQYEATVKEYVYTLRDLLLTPCHAISGSQGKSNITFSFTCLCRPHSFQSNGDLDKKIVERLEKKAKIRVLNVSPSLTTMGS